MSQNESFFDKLNSKQSFIVGGIGGVLVLCTIGFFFLLALQFTGGSNLLAESDGVNNNGTANAPTNNNGNNQPAQPANNGSISVNPVDPEQDHIRGAEDAKVTIVEFSDMGCPFCSRFHDTMKQVMDEYGEDVRWVYRHFPLDRLHPNARMMANASECAADQGKFWEFTDAAFQKQEAGFNSDTPSEIANELGLNASELETCLDNKKYSDTVKKHVSDARSAGGKGTPHSIIIGPDGEKAQIKGAQPFNVVEQQIQQFLN